MTIRETSILGSLIVRRLEATGSFVRSGARNGSKNLLKRLVTGNLRKLPKGISERLQQDIVVFKFRRPATI